MSEYIDYDQLTQGQTGVKMTHKGKPRAIGNRVLVTDMNFGEQKTQSGLIIASDDGKTRGIYPRWGKVYSKGPSNKEVYNLYIISLRLLPFGFQGLHILQVSRKYLLLR